MMKSKNGTLRKMPPFGITLIDKDGTFHYINHKFKTCSATFVGYSLW